MSLLTFGLFSLDPPGEGALYKSRSENLTILPQAQRVATKREKEDLKQKLDRIGVIHSGLLVRGPKPRGLDLYMNMKRSSSHRLENIVFHGEIVGGLLSKDVSCS